MKGIFRRDNRGLTFVEVICAVAILALVTGVIGSVIVVSTRTYRRGISETNIQQEAQLAANNIGNMIKDACGVIYGESGAQYIEDGDTLMLKADGSPKMQADGFTELSIITNEKIQYTMTYDSNNKALLYQEFDVETGSSKTGAELMAQNIRSFKADTTDFRDNRTIKLNMAVEDTDTGREIPMEYTMTSRNGVGNGGQYVTSTESVVIVFSENDIVMVPGETYEIPVSVSGKLTGGALEWESVTGVTAGELTLNHAQVTVPVNTADKTASVTIRTKDKKDDGSPKAQATCAINIRKVEEVKVTHSVDKTNSEGHMLETKGAVYTFAAGVSGNELAKRVAYVYDSNYKTAQSVVWSWTLVADGVTSVREWTCAPEADGTYKFTFNDTNKSKFDEYLSIVSSTEDAIRPELSLKVEKSMPADFRLTVRAASKHALGVNKANSQYYACAGSGALTAAAENVYWGEDFIRPRETIVKTGLELTLEPWEEGSVALDMKGGITSNVTFEYNDRSDENTKARYEASEDKVYITLGRDEKGTGNTPSAGKQKYTFTIDVKVDGVKKTTITVHVCRIDMLSIEVIDNFRDAGGALMTLPTYDFRGRINVSDGKLDQSVTQWLFEDKDAVPNTLASRITWELIDHNTASGKVKFSDSVICIAGKSAGDKGKLLGSYQKERKGYYEVINIKPARIEQKADGTWYLKQMPEIDISPKASTETGLPANTELKVTMEMLHPLGSAGGASYNKTAKEYGEAKASASIKGDLSISVPKEVIYVEPGQGTNDVAQSDEELVIPITVSSGVYRMEVSLKGTTDSGTGISHYSYKADGKGNDSYGNLNPYMAGTGTSAGSRIWYMGLVIGKNEKGNDGIIDVTIDAYKGDDKLIASADFKLALRRVNEVTVKVKGDKKLADVNNAGEKITLEAYPKGYGNDGIEYFAKQTDENGNVCRWEKENHGEYKSPYPMKWTMLYNGKEKTLAEWTEYFSAVSTSEDENSHKASATFTLLQTLPEGARLRAYSLHAYGKVSDTKYNKSGKEYDEVYGELALAGTYVVADGFQRADDYDFAKISPFENMRKYFTDWVYGSSQRTFFRYREAGTQWNTSNKQYRIMDSEAETAAFFSGNLGSRLFLPDKEYELEIVNVVYGTGSNGKKVIYWPQDASLLEAGNGWAEQGYELWDGTWGSSAYVWDAATGTTVYTCEQIYELMKNTYQTPHNYLIPRTEVSFAPVENPGSSTETISGRVKTIGSEKNPKQLSNSGSGNGTGYDKHFAVVLTPTSFNIAKTQLHFTAKIDKWEDNQWVSMLSLTQNLSMDESKYKWFLQVSVPKFDIYHVRTDASGKYRIRSTVTGMEWTKISGGLFDTGDVRYEKYIVDSIDLFDMSDESGVMYLKLN